jgi:hypothetical protein
MMKTRFFLGVTRMIVVLTMLNFAFLATDIYSATCTGSDPCNACKNCKYCRHCAREGGKCGVCK